MRSPAAAFDLRAALSDEIRGALDELDALPVKAKAIHRCRVRLKRARALARVGRNCAPGLAAVFNESARAIMHTLSQARDITALAASAREVADKANKKQAAALLVAARELETESAHMAPPDLEAVRSGLRDLLAMAQVWPEASARQISKGAERISRRAKRACVRGRGSPLAVRRHEWRKREKDRLYAATLLGAVWPPGRKRRLKRAEKLGDVLGKERDNLLLVERLEREPGLAGDQRGAARATKAIKRRLKRLSGRADALGVDLHRRRA